MNELINQQRDQIVQLTAERDALAAQVEWFAKAFSELREHHVSNFHSDSIFIGNLAVHENWKLITHAISAKNGVLHDLVYKAWVDGFEASNCSFNGEYSEDEKLPYVLAKCFADGVANKPSDSYQHHLRELRAEAGRSGFVSGYSKGWNDFGGDAGFRREELANQYADSILKGEVK